MAERKECSRRPLFRKRPPLGSGEVTRKFACAPPSKVGLCPWPRVTGTACGKWSSRKYFPESWISCRKSASALRAMRKERHPAQSFARSRPGSRPSGGLVAHLAFDHQMTPALFRPLFRASPSRGLHWRTGCRARLRRPSDLKHHAACREESGLGLSVGPRVLLAPFSSRITRLAVKVAGQGLASSKGRLTPFFSRISPRRTAGREGGLRAGLRLAPIELWATGVAHPARAWQGLQRPRPFGIPHSRRRTRFCQ